MQHALPSELPSEDISISSATAYFQGRQAPISIDTSRVDLINHKIEFTSETTGDDLFFPFSREVSNARDVTSHDWFTFVNYLFPVLDRSASEKVGNEKGFEPRAFVEQDSPVRRQRIKDVVAEWNEGFFNPRRIRITASFDSAPSSSIPIRTGSDNNGPVPVNRNTPIHPKLHRSHSVSSTSSSSSSSSSSSVDSIKSKDMEGADINTLRSALLAFRLDPNAKQNLRQSVRQLRNEFRSQRRDLPRQERKDLKREYKDQRKELKREVKAVVKEFRATRRAERKARRAERKSRRHGKRAERGSIDRVCRAQERAQRKQAKAEEKAMRAQAQGLEAQERAAEKALKAQERAADARARAQESEVTYRQRAREIEQQAQSRARDAMTQARDHSDASSEKARLAERYARDVANEAAGSSGDTGRAIGAAGVPGGSEAVSKNH